MRTFILHLNNLIFPLIPESKCFGIKRFLLRLAGAEIGKNVKLSSSLKVYGCGELIIGENTWVGYQTMIVSSSKVQIGSNVDIAPRVYIGTGTHIIDISSNHVAAKDISRDVIIGNGCWLCVNSTILPGSILGHKNIVAAGAVVTAGKTQDNALFGGIPAHIIRQY